MIVFVKIFLALLICSFLIGCSSAPAEDAPTQVVAEATPKTQVSEIADANTALAEGNRLLDDNLTEQAIEAYKRAVELDPTLGEAYFKLGIAFGLLEKEQIRSGSGDYVPGEANTGKNFKPQSVKMFERAVDVYKKYLARSDKDALAHFNLGLTYNKLNLDKEAEESFEKAVKLRPEDAELQTELGGIRVKLAKYREAIAPLKKALELDPENSQAANFLDDAEAGARRVEFNQPDNTNSTKKVAPSQRNVANSNIPADANTATRGSSNTQAPPKPPTRTTPMPRITPRAN